MSFDRRTRSFLILLALGSAALVGCTAIPPTDAEQRARQPLYEQRLERLGQLTSWSLQGRMAINAADDGGSGHLSWRQQPGITRLDFHGALGRGGWGLLATADGVELKFADGRLYRAASLEELIRAQVGWEVPVEPLAWWVRGLAAPGAYDSRLLDEDGRLSELHQGGWQVEFRRYGSVGGETMPFRMTARQDDRSVKLAIREWELAGADE